MKVGVFQCACGGLDLTARVERLQSALSGAEVDLLVCPELFASGYNVGDDLRVLADRAGGDSFDRMSEVAVRNNTAIVYGYPERGERGVLHNSAAVISSTGELIANHRKRKNSPHSFEGTYFEPGVRATFVELSGFKVAILICYEIEFPESVRAAALAGAHLVVAPTALVQQWPIVAERLVPTRAFENGVWVAYANHAGHENGFDYLGGSKIVAPDGEIVADAGRDECLVIADIDKERVAAAQARLPYLQDCKTVAD